MRYQKKREYTWSPNLAYAVGLITSDGCLQKDGRHIDVTSADLEQVKNFKVAIGRPELTISKKYYKGQKNDYYRVQFSDVSLYDFLSNIGLTPNKSLTIKNVAIPDTLFSHYLRGLFDGDGTTYAYTDKRWRSSYMYYVGYTSASKVFLENLSAQCKKLANTEGLSIRKSPKCYSLVYAKKDSQKLYDFMYHDATIYLNRKYEKLKSFTLTDINDTINKQNARVA